MVSAPSALPPNVQLIVASLDLQLVRLLRDAIRTADLSTGALRRATAVGPAPAPRQQIHPEPVYEPRVHYRPTPRFEPRRTWCPPPGAWTDRCGAWCPESAPDWSACPPLAPPAKPDCERPMEPPWKVLPWQNPPPPPPVRKVKVFVSHPDTAQKGAAINLFG